MEYLNGVEFYPGTKGIEQGARALFGKASKDLTFDEAVMLISMAQNPTLYHPRSEKNAEQHTIDLEKRTDAGLGVIFEALKNGAFQSFFREKLGMDPIVLTESELKKLQSAVTSDKIPKQFSVRLPGKNTLQRSSDGLVQEARELAGGKSVMTIETTIDRELHEGIIQAVKQEYADLLAKWPHKDVPLYCSVLVVNKKGEVLADVRGDDFFKRPLDYHKARTEMGSVVKPLVVATAIELGIIHSGSEYIDQQYVLTPEQYAGLQSSRIGKNFGGEFSNKTKLILEAILRDSDNSGVMYLFQTAHEQGRGLEFIDLVEDKLRRIDIEVTPLMDDNPMIAIGASSVAQSENIVKLYASLLNAGQTFDAVRAIKKVRTIDGLRYNSEEHPDPTPVPFMPDSLVGLILPALLERGGQVLQEEGKNIAAKTGTGKGAEELRLAMVTPGENGTITCIRLGPGVVGKGRTHKDAQAGRILRPIAKAVVKLLRQFGYASGSRPELKPLPESDTLELQPLPEDDTLQLKQLERIEREEGTKEFYH